HRCDVAGDLVTALSRRAHGSACLLPVPISSRAATRHAGSRARVRSCRRLSSLYLPLAPARRLDARARGALHITGTDERRRVPFAVTDRRAELEAVRRSAG